MSLLYAVRSFWTRWFLECITNLQQLTRWKKPSRDFQVGDIILLQEDAPFTIRWPLARVIAAADGHVKVANIRLVYMSYSLHLEPNQSLLLPVSLVISSATLSH